MGKFGKRLSSLALSIALILGSLPVISVFADDGMQEIFLDTPVKVTIENAGDESIFCFTPEDTGVYSFSSTGGADTYGYILDEHENLLKMDDDSGDMENFDITFHMSEGQTYILKSHLYGGETGSYTVTVTQLPVSAVSFNDIPVIDGYNSAWSDEYNELTGNYDLEWQRYFYQASGTITFKDGSTASFENGGYIYNGIWQSVQYADDQSYNTPWTVGNTYTVTGELMGVTDTFNVTVIQNPIEKIEVSDISIIEGANQYISHDNIDGEDIEYLRYGFNTPEFTVTFRDGTTETGRYGITIDGDYYGLSVWDDQSSSNVWGVGKHTVKASLLGVETTFTVEIVESPFVSVEFYDIELTEDLDGYIRYAYNEETDEYDIPYFYYDYSPSCTVTLKDGTTVKSKDGCITYDGQSYLIYKTDTQEDSHWTTGTYSAEASVFGLQGEFSVTVNENPYESLSISGTTELVITLTKKNGGAEVFKAVEFNAIYGDFGMVGGTLTTTEGTLDSVRFRFYSPENEPDSYDKGLTLSIGGLTSNSIDGNTWFKAQMITDDYIYAVKMYREKSEPVFGKRFEGFDGTVTDDSIDDIVILAVHACGMIWYVEDNEEINGNMYAVMDIETVKECIERVFGFTDIDLTKSSFCDADAPTKMKIMYLVGSVDPNNNHLSLENGKWVYEYIPDDGFAEDYNSVKIVMNENVQIETVEFSLYPIGDVNMDSEVDTKDLIRLMKYLAGASVSVNSPDINMDGNVDTRDLIRLMKLLAEK